MERRIQREKGKICYEMERELLLSQFVFFLLFEGMLSAWDTRQNKCFMHWEADDSEIGMINKMK